VHHTLEEDVNESYEGLAMGGKIAHQQDGSVESEKQYATSSDHGDESAS